MGTMHAYKPVRLGGVGEVVGFRSGQTPLYLGTLQNVELNFSGNVQKVYGGTGAFPVATWTPEKEIGVTADAALIEMQSIRMTQGDNAIGTTQLMLASETNTVGTDSKATVVKTKYETGKVIVLYANGTPFTKMAGTTAPSAAGTYQEDTPSAGTLTFHATDNGQSIIVKYVYSYTTSGMVGDGLDMLAIKSDARACPVEWYYNHEYTDCGAASKVQFMFYRARPTGNLAAKFEHANVADVSNGTFDIEDPLRADKHIGAVTMADAA